MAAGRASPSFWLLPRAVADHHGHLGLLMLALIVVAIMLGFPTAFTLMGMGVIFAWLAYRSVDPRDSRCSRRST